MCVDSVWITAFVFTFHPKDFFSLEVKTVDVKRNTTCHIFTAYAAENMKFSQVCF